MSSAVCSHCGCSDIDTDPARGDAVCTGCGSVLEDQIIVSEVQFQENAMGGCSVLGQYVGAEGIKSYNMGSGFQHGLGRESRAVTLQNGRRRIQQLGDQLRLSQHCVDTAYNFFKMAVSRRLTHGRKTSHVIAACLYMVCRTEGTSHMLLDFADILQVNVYALGRTYLQLSKALCINIPALDPCLFIDRFAHKLEFGDKTHEVSMTALRLVARMKRDWMAQGRRPSGICGAGLLVAARIHDFNRTTKDIMKVVKIGQGTVRKRLLEFEQTPSSMLTIDEFHKIDLEEEMDPPCFIEGKRKVRLQQLEEQGLIPELTEEIGELQKEIDTALDDAIQKKGKKTGVKSSNKPSSNSEEQLPVVPECEEELNEQGQEFLVKETLKYALDEDSQSEQLVEGILKVQSHKTDRSSTLSEMSQTPSSQLGPRPTAASLGLKDSIEECMKPVEEIEAESETGELDLSGIEDDELDKYILSDDEVKIKTRIWMDLNGEFLKEMKEKAEKRAQLEKEQGDQKKRKKPRRKVEAKEFVNAREAIHKMLQEKKISNKINYDVLKNLNQVDKKPVKEETAASLLGSGPITVEPVHLPKPSSSKSISTPRTQQSRLKKPAPRNIKLEPKEEMSSPAKKLKCEPDLVVESGPVDYAADEEEEEIDEEEDEDQHMSAAALMGQVHDDDDEIEMYDDDMD